MEYLYQQTGKVLEDVSLDPDTPDEAPAIEALEEDEGIEEDVADPTVFGPDTPSSSVAAARSGDPADAPSEPSRSGQVAPPEAPEVQDPDPQQPSSDSEVSSHTDDCEIESLTALFAYGLCSSSFLLRRTSRVLMASPGTGTS